MAIAIIFDWQISKIQILDFFEKAIILLFRNDLRSLELKHPIKTTLVINISMLLFSKETKDDIVGIHEVLTKAFGRSNEAELVQVIRASSNFIPELSLVAKEDGNVVGHILFSPIIIQAQEQNIEAIALAPLAVTPIFQHQGIGSQLVKFGLSKCRELDYKIVIVLGHPDYYKRFGFQTASKLGVQAPFPVPDEAFMVLGLKPEALINISGTVRYPAYFDKC